jgi:hypothetical protein
VQLAQRDQLTEQHRYPAVARQGDDLPAGATTAELRADYLVELAGRDGRLETRMVRPDRGGR